MGGGTMYAKHAQGLCFFGILFWLLPSSCLSIHSQGFGIKVGVFQNKGEGEGGRNPLRLAPF